MNLFSYRNKLPTVALAFSLLLLSACASTAVDGSKGGIEERVMARWAALLSGDLPAAYEFLSPATRSSVSSLQYQRSIVIKKVQWTSADYIEGVCEETVCKVRITLGFAVYGALPGVRSYEDTHEIEESWVKVDGVWYFVPAS